MNRLKNLRTSLKTYSHAGFFITTSVLMQISFQNCAPEKFSMDLGSVRMPATTTETPPKNDMPSVSGTIPTIGTTTDLSNQGNFCFTKSVGFPAGVGVTFNRTALSNSHKDRCADMSAKNLERSGGKQSFQSYWLPIDPFIAERMNAPDRRVELENYILQNTNPISSAQGSGSPTQLIVCHLGMVSSNYIFVNSGSIPGVSAGGCPF